jgi:hypothetical protein
MYNNSDHICTAAQCRATSACTGCCHAT